MVDKGRVEAFSDGVLAIAITLLVLDLHVPEPDASKSLGRELTRQWPSYSAYVVSFLVIGVIWLNHHATLRRVAAVDHTLLLLNLLLLLVVCTIPWTTSLLATYLTHEHGAHLAAVIYCAAMLVLTAVFYAMQRHILFHPRHLLHDSIDDTTRAHIDRRARVGVLPYAVATALAAASAPLALAACGLTAAYYALPTTTDETRPGHPPLSMRRGSRSTTTTQPRGPS